MGSRGDIGNDVSVQKLLFFAGIRCSSIIKSFFQGSIGPAGPVGEPGKPSFKVGFKVIS